LRAADSFESRYVSIDASAHLNELAAALGCAAQLSQVFDGLDQPVYLVDRGRTIRFWNTACERVSGYPAEAVVGRRCFDDILRHIDSDGRRLCVGLCPLAHTIKDGQTRRCRVWLQHRDGHRLAVSVVTQPIRDSDDTIIGALESFTDDSSLASVQARLAEMEWLAMVDPLTDIPNRRYLEMALSSRLAELRRYDRTLSVAALDLDDFKHVNDRFGHQVGDAVLNMVATVLAANARTEDVVARLSGDEFVVVLQNAELPTAVQVCERLNMLIANSQLERGDTRVQVTASFGVTSATREDDVWTLIGGQTSCSTGRRHRARISQPVDARLRSFQTH
jgi:diguanylate cyclase (GGDEF)-like protein/PAS domain S-box-containing protein